MANRAPAGAAKLAGYLKVGLRFRFSFFVTPNRRLFGATQPARW